MYVCICNAFTEKQVVRVLSGGALSPAGVYRHLGCTPQCGKCIPSVRSRRQRQMLRRNAVAGRDHKFSARYPSIRFRKVSAVQSISAAIEPIAVYCGACSP